MDRKMMDTLLAWRSASSKKGLVISGARQVGKTFIIDELGNNHYKHYLKLDFSTNSDAKKIFEDNIDADSIFRKLMFRFPDFRIERGDSLLFLDEIQLCPDARSSIKPLVADGRVDVIASGSLIGTMGLKRTDENGLFWERETWDNIEIGTIQEDGQDTVIIRKKDPDDLIGETLSEGKRRITPVGSEHVIRMYPMDFEEYLWALGLSRDQTTQIRRHISERMPFDGSTLDTLFTYYRQYVMIGGMPEAVRTTFENRSDGLSYMDIQRNIVNGYREDVLRYAPERIRIRTLKCMEAIPRRLGQTKKKFVYKDIENRENTGWREYMDPISWIDSAGIVSPCCNLSEPAMPLDGHTSRDFKLYMGDTGLLLACMDNGVRMAFSNGDHSINRGGITENAVANMIERCGLNLFYFGRNKVLENNTTDRIEVDFIADFDGAIAAIEVKSGNSRRSSSLNKLRTDPRYSMYDISRFIKLEPSNIHVDENGVEHYPLFAAAFMDSMFTPREPEFQRDLPLDL